MVDRKQISKKMNAFIVLTFCVFSFLFVSFQIHHYLDIRSYYLSKVQRISQSISDSFHFYYHNVQNIALHESVINKRYKTTARYFDSLIALYPQYEYILFTNTEGKLLAINSIGSDGKKIPYKSLRKTDLSGEAWYKSLQNESSTTDIRKGIFGTHFEKIGTSHFAKEYLDKEMLGNYFSTAVMNNDGEVKGYVTTFVNQNWIESKADLIDDIHSIMRQDLYVIDKKNTIVGFGKDQGDLLEQLPFELKTSNLTRSLFSGDIINLFKGVEVFLRSPLFISSQFRHNNFLDKLKWKLILKIDKFEFFKDFIYKFTGFFILFLIWSLFVKQIQAAFFKTLSQYSEVKEDVEVEKRVFFKKYYQNSFDSYQGHIDEFVNRLKEINTESMQMKPYRALEMQDPYEKFVETAQIFERTKEAFLKYEVFTENETFFAKELESYMNRSQEDLANSISEITNLKRDLLNLQVQNNYNSAASNSMELTINRVEMLISDLSRGLENVKVRNNDSRAKKAVGWGELKNFVYNHLFIEVNKFKNISEDQAFFQNDLSIYNSMTKEENEKINSQMKQMSEELNKLKEMITEFEKVSQKQHLDQEDAA